MTPTDPEAIKREIEAFLPLRDSHMTSFTDSVLVRNQATGACGLASCLYIEWNGAPYAISCQHILKDGHEYFAGAKRLKRNMIEEGDSHAVAPLRLIESDKNLDLALFELNGLSLSSIPKEVYLLTPNLIDFEGAKKNLQTVAFIHAVPGFGSRGFQYPDGDFFLENAIYSAYGPIVEVTEKLIVADFAEKEVLELNTKDFSHLKDLKATEGTRDLGGMSGSGLWVIGDDRFHLIGILLGPAEANQPATQHLIRFTPIWEIIEWLQTLQTNS